MEKLSFMKPVPAAKKVGDQRSTVFSLLSTSAALLPSGTFFPGVARSVALRAPGSALESVSLLPEAFFGGLGLAASKWVPALASFNAHSSLLA